MNIENLKVVRGKIHNIHTWQNIAFVAVEGEDGKLQVASLAGAQASEDLIEHLNKFKGTDDIFEFVIGDTDEARNVAIEIKDPNGESIFTYIPNEEPVSSSKPSDASPADSGEVEERPSKNQPSSGGYRGNNYRSERRSSEGSDDLVSVVTKNMDEAYAKGRSVMVMLWMNIKRTINNRNGQNPDFIKDVIEAANTIERFIYPSNSGSNSGSNRGNYGNRNYKGNSRRYNGNRSKSWRR